MATQNQDAPPPKVYPKLYRKLKIAMVLALLGGPVVVGIGFWESYQMQKLKSEGVHVAGKVLTSNAVATGKGRTSYRITVDYKPTEHQIYRKQFVVAPDTYQTAQKAGEITVTYLPSDPSRSAVGDYIQVDNEPFAIGAGVFVFGVLLWFYLRRVNARVDAYVRSAC